MALISVDHKNNIIEIKGKVTYCKKKSEKCKTGISFEGTHAQYINFTQKLIKSYHYKKSEYFAVPLHSVRPVLFNLN